MLCCCTEAGDVLSGDISAADVARQLAVMNAAYSPAKVRRNNLVT